MAIPDPKIIRPQRDTVDTSNNLKKYVCPYCKEAYMMAKKKHAQLSMQGTKNCQSQECMLKAANRLIEKRRKKEASEWRKEKKVRKEKAKSVSDWKSDLQKEVNWIARELDKSYGCISHPGMAQLRWDAGHYFAIGSQNHDIRFNVHNIHKQGSQANELHGGCPEYRIGLVKRYGDVYAKMVDGLKLRWNGIAKEKYTIPNIRDIYLPNARLIKRRMNKGERFTRDQVNEMIGIYV